MALPPRDETVLPLGDSRGYWTSRRNEAPVEKP